MILSPPEVRLGVCANSRSPHCVNSTFASIVLNSSSTWSTRHSDSDQMKENFWFAFTGKKTTPFVWSNQNWRGSWCYPKKPMLQSRHPISPQTAESLFWRKPPVCPKLTLSPCFHGSKDVSCLRCVGQPGIMKASGALLPHYTNTRCSGIHLTISNALSMTPFINWESFQSDPCPS